VKLVLVHGRSQQRKDPAQLQEQWLDALRYGAERADAALPDDLKVEFPFYGDLLDDLVRQTQAAIWSEVNAKGPNPDTADMTLRGELIEEIARSAGLTEADIARELAAEPIERGPGNWEWIQAALRALDRVPGFNGAVIDVFTRDVFVYLAYPAVRKQVDKVVADAIGDEPCVVVAHSLGTVVAFNTLRARAASPECLRLVTLGSPLGIRAIKNRLTPTPISSPACVRSWFNAYDDRDPVALVALDAANFDVQPPIENKSDVANFTDNRHGIEGYLSDPVVARKLVEVL
jgi:hypothetical protein